LKKKRKKKEPETFVQLTPVNSDKHSQ